MTLKIGWLYQNATVTDCAIVMQETEGHVENWNLAAQRINGYSEAEIFGHHITCGTCLPYCS